MENSTTAINQDVNSKSYIWIDSEINNLNNTKTFDLIFDNNSNIKCKKFETIEEAINHIKHNEEINKFKNIHVIVSGSLYIEFYYKISEELNNFTFWPTIIVYLKKKQFHYIILNYFLKMFLLLIFFHLISIYFINMKMIKIKILKN